MGRTKNHDEIRSNLIISEVQKRACLYDSNHPNYGDRAEKARSWEEVCENVLPGWSLLGLQEKIAAGKEVQKRWRSIRDSYTKAYRQGKCVPPEQCSPGSRRYHYHRQMSFLLRALHNKKPRYSLDKCDSISEVSSSPQHVSQDEDVRPRIKQEVIDKPLDLKKKPEPTEKSDQEKPKTVDKCNQASIDKPNKSLEIKIDANSILPDDHFDDDKLFMNSLLPLFRKMDDDTRLLCRIEVLKIIRFALQGNKTFEAIKMAEDSFFKNRLSGILAKEEVSNSVTVVNKNESTLSMTTRSADGSRPIRNRRARSPSPLVTPPRKRGPGRPRKARPPPSDSDEEVVCKKKSPKLRIPPVDTSRMSEMDESLNKVSSITQLSTPLFMKMYNLERSKNAPTLPSQPNIQMSIKTEPVDESYAT